MAHASDDVVRVAEDHEDLTGALEKIVAVDNLDACEFAAGATTPD